MPKFVDLSPSHVVDDDALKSCINVMYANQSKLYNTTDLYDMYLYYGGKLSHKQMFAKLNKCLADDMIVIRCDGCASLVGFKEFVGKMMKLVKASSDEEEGEVDTVIRQVQKEARDVNKSSNFFYDLGNFTHSNTISQTSPTPSRLGTCAQ